MVKICPNGDLDLKNDFQERREKQNSIEFKACIQDALRFPSSNKPLSIITNYNWQTAPLTRWLWKYSHRTIPTRREVWNDIHQPLRCYMSFYTRSDIDSCQI